MSYLLFFRTLVIDFSAGVVPCCKWLC